MFGLIFLPPTTVECGRTNFEADYFLRNGVLLAMCNDIAARCALGNTSLVRSLLSIYSQMHLLSIVSTLFLIVDGIGFEIRLHPGWDIEADSGMCLCTGAED